MAENRRLPNFEVLFSGDSLMNCDQAFEVMTEPGTVRDEALEAHLQQCPRCRDMAEILEPALRFVTGQGDDAWPNSAWEPPPAAHSQPATPFLSQQAVRAAEEAAAALTSRKPRKTSDRRGRWLAVGLLAPLILAAILLAERLETDKHERSHQSAVAPELGQCLRGEAARTQSADDQRLRNARDIVLSCNTCHLLSFPRESDVEPRLKLRPAGFDHPDGRQPVSGQDRATGWNVDLRWDLAGLASQNRKC